MTVCIFLGRMQIHSSTILKKHVLVEFSLSWVLKNCVFGNVLRQDCSQHRIHDQHRDQLNTHFRNHSWSNSLNHLTLNVLTGGWRDNWR